MKEIEIMVCRSPGYWDGSCSSTPKSERIKELSGRTMSGERLDGREDIDFSTSSFREEKIKKKVTICKKCGKTLERKDIDVIESPSKRTNVVVPYHKSVLYCENCDIYYGRICRKAR